MKRLIAFFSILAVVLISIAFIGSSYDRYNFSQIGRATFLGYDTVPERAGVAISFGDVLSWDTLYLRDAMGHDLLKIEPQPTFAGIDYSNMQTTDLGGKLPFGPDSTLENSRVRQVVENLTGCSLEAYLDTAQIKRADEEYVHADYVQQALHPAYLEKVLYPLERQIFDKSIMLSNGNPNSALRSVRLNRFGTIDGIRLWNGAYLYFKSTGNTSATDLFARHKANLSRDELIDLYEERLSHTGLWGERQEAIDLADSQITEILYSLRNDTFEVEGIDTSRFTIMIGTPMEFPAWVHYTYIFGALCVAVVIILIIVWLIVRWWRGPTPVEEPESTEEAEPVSESKPISEPAQPAEAAEASEDVIGFVIDDESEPEAAPEAPKATEVPVEEPKPSPNPAPRSKKSRKSKKNK